MTLSSPQVVLCDMAATSEPQLELVLSFCVKWRCVWNTYSPPKMQYLRTILQQAWPLYIDMSVCVTVCVCVYNCEGMCVCVWALSRYNCEGMCVCVWALSRLRGQSSCGQTSPLQDHFPETFPFWLSLSLTPWPALFFGCNDNHLSFLSRVVSQTDRLHSTSLLASS